MELIFQTKKGAQLYAEFKGGEIVSLHSADAHLIRPALLEDVNNKTDHHAHNMAVMLLGLIDQLGIEWIEG